MKKLKKICILTLVLVMLSNITTYTNKPLALFAQEDQNVYDVLDSKIKDNTYNGSSTFSSLNNTQQQEIKQLLIDGFNTQVDNVALRDVAELKTEAYIKSSNTEAWNIYLEELRKAVQEGVEETQRSKVAKERTLVRINATITENDEYQALASIAKIEFTKLIENNLLESKSDITINQLLTDLPAIYRGTLLLSQQYSFEDDLSKKLVFEPHTIKGIASSNISAYDRLIAYGGTKDSFNINKSFLTQYDYLFQNRKIKEYTGFNNLDELVLQLAQNKGKDVKTYFEETSEAQILSIANKSAYEILQERAPNYIYPLLMRGKGAFLGVTNGHLVLGMLEAYAHEQDASKLQPHTKDTPQDQNPFFRPMLENQDNYKTFLESVNKTGQDIPFTICTDSFYHIVNNKRTWSKAYGEDAALSVRTLFKPLGVYDSSYNPSSMMGAVSTSASSLVAYVQALMTIDMSGVGTYAHEMTHGNDRTDSKALLGVSRRTGLGQEIVTRSMFETENLSPSNNRDIKPSFLFNTTTPITNTDRIQSSEALNTKEKLETYSEHLINLIMFLEAKEAEIVLQKQEADKKAYYLQVTQVKKTKQSTYDWQTNEGYTTDKFDVATVAPNTIDDLVNNGYVSGQFVAHGQERITTIQPNQYDYLPLLESFYAANVSTGSDIGVGDLSTKRILHELIGYFDYESMVKYLSSEYTSDREALQSIGINDYKQFKIDKYKELLEKKLFDSIISEDELTTKLTTAINADLELLKNSSLPSSYINTNATNVRKVKQEILNKALALNDLKQTVLEDKTTTFKVTFASNNTTYGNVSESEISVETNTTIDLDGNNLKIGQYTITPNPSPSTNQYTYEFESWTYDNSSTKPEKVVEDLSITANFKQIINKYTITFESNDQNIGTVDQATLDSIDYGTQINVSNNQITVNGQTIQANPKSETEDKTFEFVNWTLNSNEFTTSTLEQNITLVANFKEVNKKGVNYKVEIIDWTDSQNPPGLDTINSYNPTDTQLYNLNETVVAKQPTSTTLSVTNNDGRPGKWTFVNVKEGDSQQMSENGVTFTLIWKFQYYDKKPITYTFEKDVSTLTGVNLPNEVNQFKPNDTSEYETLQFTPQQPTQTTYVDNVSTNPGTWTFINWQGDTIVSSTGINFEGIWKYTPQTFTITYKIENGTWADNQTIDKTEQVVLNNTLQQIPTGMQANTGYSNGHWVDETPNNSDLVTQDKVYTYKFDINTYTIEFETNNGTPTISNQQVNHGQTLQQPTSISKANYTLEGWYTDEGFVNKYNFDEPVVNNLKLYAKWIENSKYEVTYKFESFDGQTLPSNILNLLPKDSNTYYLGDNVSVNTNTFTDQVVENGKWQFVGWENSNITINTSNNEFIGKWKFLETTFSVKLYNDENVLLSEQTIGYGKSLDYTVPQKASNQQFDYQFDKWLIKGTTTDATDKLQSVKSDLEVVASYIEVIRKYTVKFVKEDMVTEIESKTIEYNTEASITTPIKDSTDEFDYKFDKWLLLSDHSDATSKLLNVKENFVVYPSFTQTVRQYTVTFLDKDKVNTLNTQTVNYNTQAKYEGTGQTPQEPIEAGKTFTFIGWFMVDGDSDATNNLQNVTTNFSVYPKFLDSTNKHTIKFYNEDKTELLDTQVVDYGTSASYKANGSTPIKASTVSNTFTFNSWKLLSDDSDPSDKLLNVQQDLEVYATFDTHIRKYTVNFLDKDLNIFETQSVDYNTSAQTPSTNPTKDNYTFKGWLQDYTSITSDLDVKPNFKQNIISNPTTLDADYVLITFDATTDGKLQGNDYGQLVKYGVLNHLTWKDIKNLLEQSVEFKQESYKVFIGWNNAANDTDVIQTTTLTAKFKYKIVELNPLPQYYLLNSNSLVSLRLSGEFNDFASVKVDGVEIVNGKDYEVSQGSTIILFKPEYLNTLTVKKYNVEVTFNNATDKYLNPVSLHELNIIAQLAISKQGRTCQDDGYPIGYVWSDSKQACILETTAKKVVNTSVNN